MNGNGLFAEHSIYLCEIRFLFNFSSQSLEIVDEVGPANRALLLTRPFTSYMLHSDTSNLPYSWEVPTPPTLHTQRSSLDLTWLHPVAALGKAW
jgi:hypothetical protein